MKHSESLSNIAPAIMRAQHSIKGALKDATNPFFKSKYADLESCWVAIKGPLHTEGLSVVQTMGFIPNAGPTLITTLLHASGEYISGEQPVCAKSDNPQELGSAITYARRYGLSAIVGLIQVDDDAEEFVRGKPKSEGSAHGLGAGIPNNPGAYIMKMGKKHKGKRLDEIDIYELDGFGKWLAMRNQDSDPEKHLDALGVETLEAIEKFLMARETKGAK